jgi:hypothetical protein
LFRRRTPYLIVKRYHHNNSNNIVITMTDVTPSDVEQPKPSTEETQKTTAADETGSAGSINGGDTGSAMLKPIGEMGDHEKALEVSSGRDMNDTRTKPFVVIVAVAAALGGLIFGYDSKCRIVMTRCFAARPF